MKHKLAAFLFFAYSVPLFAQKGPPGPAAPSAELGFRSIPSSGFKIRETSSALYLPLVKSGPYSLGASAHFLHMRVTDAQNAPGELYKTGSELSAENGGKDLKIGFESNSDRPLYGLDTVDLIATYTFMLSEKGGHALIGGVNYSSQRSFAPNIPIPFISYRYQSENFFMIFPFMYRFRLSEKTSLTVRYAPVKNFTAALRYQASASFHTDLEAGGELDQFLLAGRTDKKMRFYYQRYTAALKPSLRLSGNMRLDGAAGYLLSGYYYHGKTYDNHRDRSNMDSAPYFSLSLKYTFKIPSKPTPPERNGQ